VGSELPARPPDAPSRGGRLLLSLVAALPVLLTLVPHDLWPPEEPRFGRIAHEMAEGGDWLVTHLSGKADAEKPPLLWWAMAGVERLVGRPTPWGMRLPEALLAAFAVLATTSLARRWFRDDALATTAGILFGTTALVLWNGPRVGLDLPLAAFSVVALEGATSAIVDGSWRGALRLGLGIGLGLLAKGPHVLYVPLAGAAGGAYAARGLPRPRGAGLRVGAGVLLGLAILAAWLVPALLVRGDQVTWDGPTYRDRLLGQLTRRLSGEREPHLHGPLYLLPVLLAYALPWTGLVVAGVASRFRVRRAPAEDRFGLGAALGGLLVPLVLLSLASSKRETYLVPLLPCAAILSAHVLHRVGDARHATRGVGVAVVALAALAAAVAAAPFVAPSVYPGDRYDVVTGHDLARTPVVVACAALALLLAGCAVASWRTRARPVRAARLTAAFAAAAALAGGAVFVPFFDPAGSFADAVPVARREAPGAPFHVARTSDPSSLWAFGFDRVESRVDDYPALARVLAPDAPRALILAKGSFWTKRPDAAQRTDADRDVHAALDRVRVLWERRVSGTTWHLLTNAP
jgi:4-amino-4-deoxy-L-arabinose transferase-like glycosyltransferase